MYEALSKKYKSLELSVFVALVSEIEKSTYKSEHMDEKAIKVNVFDYTELVRINERLTFLDANGLHYSVYAECSLEDLIDILNKIK